MLVNFVYIKQVKELKERKKKKKVSNKKKLETK